MMRLILHSDEFSSRSLIISELCKLLGGCQVVRGWLIVQLVSLVSIHRPVSRGVADFDNFLGIGQK